MASFRPSTISSSIKEIVTDLSPFIRVYSDGTVERLFAHSPSTPPSPEGDPQTGVLSKDVVISDDPSISARLFLPKSTSSCNSTQQTKLPILVYYHGGGFCIDSAFSFVWHRYLNYLVSEANVIAVSVDYRLAPEHPLPAAYGDSWVALQWVASHSADSHSPIHSEPWLISHGDFDRVYLGGDSAGGNIVHNMALRAGVEKLPGDVKILGAFQSHTYFWSSNPIGSEPVEGHDQSFPLQIWKFVYPSAPGGIDNPLINPVSPGAPSLAGLACSKLLVTISGEDFLRERGVMYYEAVRRSGWQGELELFEIEEENHCFQLSFPESESTKKLVKRLALFMNQ